MSLLWQQIVAGLAVAAAAAYLAARFFVRRYRKPACSECALMKAARAAESRPLDRRPAV